MPSFKESSDFTENLPPAKDTIYEELRMIFKPRRYKQIDKEWKIESNQKLLKKLRNNTNLLD